MNDVTTEANEAERRSADGRWLRIWDLPTRLFHWSLVALMVVSLYTGNVGGLREMDLHKLSGYAILALVLFRLVWGLIGSRRSRFADFVRGPAAVIAYARSMCTGEYRPSIGHNPLGGWSVMALLASLLLQAGTGLFAQDDIFTKGPLVKYVAKATSDTLTVIHAINANVLYVLIGLHLAAVFGYLLLHNENLIRPMFTGRKPAAAGMVGEDGRFASIWVALMVIAVAGGLVWAIVTA